MSQLLPSLNGWETSGPQLHASAQILGALRLLVRERSPNFLELALRVERGALSSETLANGGIVRLPWSRAALVYQPSRGEITELVLNGRSQSETIETLVAELASQGDVTDLIVTGEQSYADAMLATIHAKGYPSTLTADDLQRTQPFVIDTRVSRAYGEVLERVFTAIARFRAHLQGPMTPMVVWPEHFDLSFLWFATAQASDNHPHINFGFAPFSDGIPLPYLYAYAYPMPADFTVLPLLAPARWNTVGWNGVIVDYRDLAADPEPEALIERLCESIYSVLAPTLG